VIERVGRLKAQHQRRVAVLFEDDRREQCRLEAMGATVPDHAAKAAKGGTPARFVVVGEPVEEPLHRQRRAQAGNDPPLARRELLDRVSSRRQRA
jgi:hypothetical protein